MRLSCWQWRQVYIGNSAHLPASDRLLSCNLVFSCNYRLYGGLIILQHTAERRSQDQNIIENYNQTNCGGARLLELGVATRRNLSHSLPMEQFGSNKKCF